MIEEGPTKIVASIFLFLHMIVSYVLNQQVIIIFTIDSKNTNQFCRFVVYCAKASLISEHFEINVQYGL